MKKCVPGGAQKRGRPEGRPLEARNAYCMKVPSIICWMYC